MYIDSDETHGCIQLTRDVISIALDFRFCDFGNAINWTFPEKGGMLVVGTPS